MRNLGSAWQSIANGGPFELRAKAIINGTTYTAITPPEIYRSLMDTPLTVGKCNAATLSVNVLTDDVIPKAAEVEIQACIANDSATSAYRSFGKFFINRRSKTFEGLLNLSCYDALLKADSRFIQVDEDDAAIIHEEAWPKAMTTVVNMIATRIGVALDSRTVINTGADYIVGYPNDLSMKQIMEYIAACHGGNWIVTEENKLWLVPLFNTSGSLITIDTVLGDLDKGDACVVSGVSMETDSGEYVAGDKNGGVIALGRNPYATEAICDALNTRFNGFSYYPFSATKAVFNPAAELSDRVMIGDTSERILATEKLVFDVGFYADISAPNNEEVGDEYPYLSDRVQTKNDVRKLKETVATLTVAKGLIEARVEEVETGLGSILSQTAEQISIAINAISFDHVTTTTGYTFDAEGLKIHRSDSTVHSVVDNTGLYVYDQDAELLSVNELGAVADTVFAKEHLMIGRTVFEEYEESGEKRTACIFYE